MSQWNASSDFWMPPAATLPESSKAQDERERKSSSSARRAHHQNPPHPQNDALQWQPGLDQPGLDLFTDRDLFPNTVPQPQKAPKLVGDMSGSYPYSQPGMQPHQASMGSSSSDAYAPLPREYQSFLSGPQALPLPEFGDNFQTTPLQQDAYNFGPWPQHQQTQSQQLPQVSASQAQFQPIDASRPDLFDATGSTLNDGFNFQFNDHSLVDLPNTSSIVPPTLQFHAPDLTGVNTHLSENFVLPSTEGYNGYGYDPITLPMGHENIGLAIAGPPQTLYPQNSYAMASIPSGRSEGATSSLAKSLSPQTTDSISHRGRIPSEAKAVLEQHFEQNAYPTKEEVEQLANKLGLKSKTVKNWFGNTRQRRPCSGKSPGRSWYSVKNPINDLIATVEPTEGPNEGSVAVARDSQGNPIPTQLTSQSLDNASLSSGASSIERFEKEPLEDGPVTLETIERAAPTYKTFLALNNPEELAQTYNPRPSGPRSVASSTGESTGASSTSGASGLSSSSAKSATSLGRAPRRGRRRYRHNPYGTKPGKDDAKSDPLQDVQGGKTTKYHCTWCFARFARPYEWKRHQETLHVPRQVWVCTPGAKKDDLQPPQVCPYCMKLYPDEQHLQEHNYYTCAKKSTSKRTFARKDHLFQHIRQVHLKHADEEQLNPFSEWKGEAEQVPPESRALWCGFCRRYHSSWEKRVKDVARHFGEGEDLSTWWDPDVGWLRPSRYKDSNLPLTVTCRCCAQPKTFDNQQDAR